MSASDPLAALLHHFNAEARLFYTGNLCGGVPFDDTSGVGYLHLMRGGRARLHDTTGFATELTHPTLVFYARPLSHWLDGDREVGADLACASVLFRHQAFNPVALSLPPRLIRPLAQLPAFGPLLEVLFNEAFSGRQGRQEVLNRLFEVVLIELLRSHLNESGADPGLLRGLAHPQIGRALNAIHAKPETAWSLEALANEAAMSRTAFAATFKDVVGTTPGDYLTRWRISVAQALLRDGVALKSVVERVGYDSQAGFLRAFKAIVGMTPTAWKRAAGA